MLHIVAITMSVGWGWVTTHALIQEESKLEKQIKNNTLMPIKQQETQTMEDIKKQLGELFALPIPGISFSVLILDEEGMRIRGKARTLSSLETWLANVGVVFRLDAQSSQQTSGNGWAFEVMLHEKP